jgi:two-component system OmpR family sensor kinase
MEISNQRGDEVRVLAEAFNRMLDRLAEAFANQRAFVADASHELRTPLTVIRGQLEVLASQENPSSDEVSRVERLAQAEIARISRLVDDLLVLAQAEQTDFLRAEAIDVRPFVTDLWNGLSLTADGSREGPVSGWRSCARSRGPPAQRSRPGSSHRIGSRGRDRSSRIRPELTPAAPASVLEAGGRRLRPEDDARATRG